MTHSLNDLSVTKNEFKEVPLYRVELTRDRTLPLKSLTTKEATLEVLHQILDKSPVEKMVALYLDINYNLVGAETVSIGAIDHVEVPMRELFRGAIVAGVPYVILSHNHAQGLTKPSDPDIAVTGVAINVGNMLGIQVLDHIIVSPNGKHYSIMGRENLWEIQDRLDMRKLDSLMYGLNSKQPLGKMMPLF